MNLKQLAEIAKSPERISEALLAGGDYDALYHLSPIRQNLLEWYPFEEDASILEIGAECGALTGLLCERASSVVALEKDANMIAVNQARNGGIYGEKLRHIEGGLEQLADGENFDYIVAVGLTRILDSLGISLVEFLGQIKCHLSANGTLLLAMDNPFGLRYFGGTHFPGAVERFDSIEGKKANAFTKEQVLSGLVECGFNLRLDGLNITDGPETAKVQTFYPVPDIRLPQEIFTEARMPGPGDIRHTSDNYQRQEYRIFDEDLAFDGVCAAGKFDEFANGYLLEIKI